MIRKLALITLLSIGLQAPAYSAQLVEIGQRQFVGDESEFAALGTRILLPLARYSANVELGVSLATDLIYGGSELDVSFGLTNLNLQQLEIEDQWYWAAGGAYFKRSVGYSRGRTGAYYLRLGYLWPKANGGFHGVDLRYLNGPDLKTDEISHPEIGYYQISYQFGWR